MTRMSRHLFLTICSIMFVAKTHAQKLCIVPEAGLNNSNYKIVERIPNLPTNTCMQRGLLAGVSAQLAFSDRAKFSFGASYRLAGFRFSSSFRDMEARINCIQLSADAMYSPGQHPGVLYLGVGLFLTKHLSGTFRDYDSTVPLSFSTEYGYFNNPCPIALPWDYGWRASATAYIHKGIFLRATFQAGLRNLSTDRPTFPDYYVNSYAISTTVGYDLQVWKRRRDKDRNIGRQMPKLD